MAEKVMIIRHGEKPLVPDGLGQIMPFGLLENGEHSKYGLTVRGWQRAGALAILFAPEGAKFRPSSLTTPNTIFASAIDPRSWSRRMQLTIGPLRQKLARNIAVNTKFRKGDEEQIVAAALKCSGTVLICWAHEALPLIGAKILGKAEEIPSIWPEHRFDLIWVFDRRQEPSWLDLSAGTRGARSASDTPEVRSTPDPTTRNRIVLERIFCPKSTKLVRRRRFPTCSTIHEAGRLPKKTPGL